MVFAAEVSCGGVIGWSGLLRAHLGRLRFISWRLACGEEGRPMMMMTRMNIAWVMEKSLRRESGRLLIEFYVHEKIIASRERLARH